MTGRRSAYSLVMVFWLTLTCLTTRSVAMADGGTLRFAGAVGDNRVAVFTEPEPLRAGPMHVSVLLHRESPLPEATQIKVCAIHTASGRRVMASTSAEQLSRQALRTVQLNLPMPGDWRFEIRVQAEPATAESPVPIEFAAVVAAPLPRWRELAGWIIWPLIPIGLFSAHTLLAARRRRV